MRYCWHTLYRSPINLKHEQLHRWMFRNIDGFSFGIPAMGETSCQVAVSGWDSSSTFLALHMLVYRPRRPAAHRLCTIYHLPSKTAPFAHCQCLKNTLHKIMKSQFFVIIPNRISRALLALISIYVPLWCLLWALIANFRFSIKSWS